MAVKKPELRLALAMRGGVSLSVWIGGAVAEIDLARRAKRNRGTTKPVSDAQRFWDHLLEHSPYEQVVADVLAGASAGGLNGVLYAASQVYDFDYDGMRDIWLTVGDTDGLVRRRRTPEGERRKDWSSLFMGDDYFLVHVRKGLLELIGDGPDEEHTPPRLDLALSATSLEPIERPLPSPVDEPLSERRHASGFRFRSPAAAWATSSFPPVGDDPEFRAAIERLALAARSTSSFPAAFEAALVRSTRRPTFSVGPAEHPTVDPVDLDGAFLDRTEGPDFVVADGGILDNIPIARALEATMRAPADGPTARALLYLQPGSTSAAKEREGLTDDDERRSTTAVLTGAFASRFTGENINSDIAAIEAHNEAVARSQALRIGRFDAIRNATGLVTAARAGWATYRAARAGEDARRTSALLHDPIGFIGHDPFPRSVGEHEPGDARWRSPIAAWEGAEREELSSRLFLQLGADLPSYGPRANVDIEPALTASGDPGPLRRIVLLLLEWARLLDEHPLVGGHKASLYRVQAFIDEVLVRAWDQAWVALAACSSTEDAARFSASSVGRLRGLYAVPGLDVEKLLQAVEDDDRATVREVRHQVFARITTIVDGRRAGRHDPELLRGIAQRLADIATDIVKLDARITGERRLDPAILLDRALRPRRRIQVRDLAALEVVCFDEFVSGLPGRRRLEFQRCSSENRTPIASSLVGLATETSPIVDDKIPVKQKLAGNELSNFSAFLLPQWRANDWMWGRMDAVVNLVDLLVQPKALRAALGPAPNRRDRFWALLATHDAEDEQARRWIEQKYKAEVDDELDQLSPSGSVQAIRDALIAWRQWAILKAEWSSPPPAGVRPHGLGFDEWVRRYDVGAQTLQHPAHRREVARKLRAITTAAGESLVWNLEHEPSPWNPPDALSWLIRRPGAWLGRRIVGWKLRG